MTMVETNGPGQMNAEKLGEFAADAFVLCLLLPNDTIVSQERDQLRGLFGSAHQTNLVKLDQDHPQEGLKTSFAASIVGLLVFGETDAATGNGGHRDAFANAVSVQKNEWTRKTVGTAPTIQACLSDLQANVPLLEIQHMFFAIVGQKKQATTSVPC